MPMFWRLPVFFKATASVVSIPMNTDVKLASRIASMSFSSVARFRLASV